MGKQKPVGIVVALVRHCVVFGKEECKKILVLNTWLRDLTVR
jgi:hypothetical protein